MTVEEFIIEWQSDESYICAHTSGSTGSPKQIKLSKSLVAASAERTIDFFSLNNTSRLHLALSPDYIAGKMMIVRALLAGCTLTYESPSNRPLQGLTSNERISLLAVVPSQLPAILDKYPDSFPAIDNMIVGGSAIPASIKRRLVKSGINAYETYGMTETASHVALRNVSNDADSPFVALPGITFGVADNDALVVNVPGMEPLITRDSVSLIDERRFVLNGRLDNVIISGAIKVHPERVEALLSELIARRSFYITSRPDEKWGDVPVLKIEGAPFADSDMKILADSMKKILSPAERPADVIFCEEFMRTDSGKIIRD